MDGYTFDAFDDGSSRMVGELQLNKLSTFIDEYSAELREFEEALDESLSDVWDASVDPIKLYIRPHEQTEILQLGKTENKIFTKVATVFATLCHQVKLLAEQAESKFYAPLVMFGEMVSQEVAEGDIQIQIGKMLPFIMELSTLVNRAYAIVRNFVNQLASLYHDQKNVFTVSFRNVHLQMVYDHLGVLFNVLITLDQIITDNFTFTDSYNRFIRMTKSITSDPSRYNTEADKLFQTEKLLFSLKGQLIDGLIFQNCIEQEFDFPGLVEVKNNKSFRQEFFQNLKGLYATVSAKLGSTTECNTGESVPGLYGLYAFYLTVFRDPSDKGFFKNIWELHKKLPMVNLYGNITWFPADFLKKVMPQMSKLVKDDVTAARKDYLKNFSKDFNLRIKQYCNQVRTWMVRMESNLSNRGDLTEILHTRNSLFMAGPVLAYQIATAFKTLVGLHLNLRVAMSTTLVRHLCQLAELLKSIESTFHRRGAVVGETITLMMRQIESALIKGVSPVRQKLEGMKKLNDQELDVLAACRLAISMLSGPATTERRILLRLSLHVMFQMNILKDPEVDDIRGLLKRLDLVCELQDSIRNSCNCAFLYWNREIAAPYFDYLYKHPMHAQRLRYILAAMGDVIPLFQKAVHVDPEVLITSYKKSVEDALQKHIIGPLCIDIETDLRHHIHSHLEVSERNPYKNGMKDLSRFVAIKPIRLFDRTMDIRAHVAHYLDTTFYNLNTVALYDWKTYGQMRNLAEYKYGLSLTEVHLPGQTLEQGLDVLEIMRNIHIFVARYNYNLNNQIFIERQSESKTLNTINIGHISNSIRTHGTGIMNTTVNFTYQFLRLKFNIFSQFLYDEHIKARLYKDIKYFKENRDQISNMYPFERAKKFNKDIRTLGVTDAGLSFLDQFRVLITHIGNAMGYIRLVRSGGLYYVANAIKYVPDLQDIAPFEELVTKESLAPETTIAAKVLDQAVHSLSKNFAEGTEYFKMLVSVFTTEFRNPDNVHLRNFYMIIPPLTLNFIEHIMLAKDKLFKKTKNLGGDSLMFFDDGFAIGLAYILKLLDQNKEFDSLHWFEAVHKRFEDEKKNVEASNAKRTKEDQNTTTLTIKKLKAQQMEFELFKYSFFGARIFFKD